MDDLVLITVVLGLLALCVVLVVLAVGLICTIMPNIQCAAPIVLLA